MTDRPSHLRDFQCIRDLLAGRAEEFAGAPAVLAPGRRPLSYGRLAQEVDRIMRSAGSRPRGIEGRNDVNWILHDFGDIVLHVFSPEARKLYDLEHLWADAPRVDWKAALDGAV